MQRSGGASKAVAVGFLVAGLVSCTGQAARQRHYPFQDASRPIAARVEDLLGRMSLPQKIAQMVLVERNTASPEDVGSVGLGGVLSAGGSAPDPNTAANWAQMVDGYQKAALQGPLPVPILYGTDAVHGHNNLVGATLFPHQIGLGATRDPALVQRVEQATAQELAGTGPRWDFAPCVCVVRDARWGRTYESFGEDPRLVTSMGSAAIEGLQGANVLATAKHYLGDGGTTGGTDQGNTQLTEAQLRAIHLPPFRAAVDQNVASVMISYSSWNGAKLHGDRHLIQDVLKGELGFKGFVVSDFDGIQQMDGQRGLTATEVSAAVNAGIDMAMLSDDWRSFIDLLSAEVGKGHVPLARINDAVRRILTQKFRFGLFEHPYTDRSLASTIGSPQHRELARQAVRESAVLLKNDGRVLPLPKTGGKIFVAGDNADDIGNQSGGWSVTWQGHSGPITRGTTILAGIRGAVAGQTTVTYNRGGNGLDSSYRAAIAVVGERPYAEGRGDSPSGVRLADSDTAMLNRLSAAGVPLIVVLVSGRPMDVHEQLPSWRALLAAWLPGTEGEGVADVLFGDYNPTGRLPLSWPATAIQEPMNAGKGRTPLFLNGYGLSF
ncbi:glycoside hydrolase family 3 N-terminal domain-containing protein [Pedococcus sp. KACC 23699]|uniref:beta-glucosidase n=1 Tax=Pedococcus sp. KACC 23699 TaxID=3149228 RepID=A0AAU7JS45_9MICO